ncbi:MAG TPA: lipid A biosynthesis acyltransferase [Gammaproteobacteria bacterium]|nr:lipid A biosynthesis acyltransferase [Gammaproteobacteria bacterium]
MTESVISKPALRAFFARKTLQLFALLPLPANHLVGALFGWLAWKLPTRAKRITLRNLERCYPELRFRERNRMVQNSLIETGKTATEMGPLWLWPEQRIQRLICQVSGEQHLHDALHRRKGVILAIPHLGAWEMVGLYCSLNHSITALYRPPRLEGMDAMVRQGRERFGATLVPTDAGGVRALYKTLGRGEIVCILPDQVPSAGQGVFAPFFAISANTMTLLSRLGQKFGSEVIFCYAERLPRGRGFHIHFSPAPEQIHDADPLRSATALNQGVEQCVRALPEQYQWSYKRFRSRPPGESGFYK